MRIPSFAFASLQGRDATSSNQDAGRSRERRGGAFGGGGGARGGGSISSGGSKGSSGSSSSGSSGAKGASSGGKIAGGRPGSSQPRTVTSQQLPVGQRGAVYGSRGVYGYGRPAPGAVPLLYGFWPLSWYSDTPEGVAPDNATRPGGPLLAAGLQAPSSPDVTYVVYGDTQSLDALFPVLSQNCSAANATAPADLSGNTTLEQYRDDSFALYRFAAPNAPLNQSLESCLNATIGNNLLVAGTGQLLAPWMLASLLALAVGLTGARTR